MNPQASTPFSVRDEIKRLEAKIAELRGGQLRELKERRKVLLAEVESIDREIAKITNTSNSPAIAIPKERQGRRINDDDLKRDILKVLAERGATGLSIPEIAEYVGQNPPRIRKFIASNPKALKQQGAGRGTRYFLP